MQKIIVRKYGGATIDSPEKIKSIAESLALHKKNGESCVAIVSAMGETTNQLIQLAHKVSVQPTRREMDMLLTTGERVSMALLSMALHDQGCDSISLTGSQAGIFTDEDHLNAHIIDVKGYRIDESLRRNKIVVLAGFQGVSPTTKEITTLGRGGTDTTAVAISIYLKAQLCEILKEVPSLFTADPRLIKTAQPIKEITYPALLDMTFWGAKLMHYRSVELAAAYSLPLYIGPAHSHSSGSPSGTFVRHFLDTSGGSMNFENPRILGVNSHAEILRLEIRQTESSNPLETLKNTLQEKQIYLPQILHAENVFSDFHIYVTGPSETLTAIKTELQSELGMKVSHSAALASVTVTCHGIMHPDISIGLVRALQSARVSFEKMIYSPASITFFVAAKDRVQAIDSLHSLVIS
jgi:aspartate kinase